MYWKIGLALATATALSTPPPTPPAPATPMKVNVNGKPVDFAGPPPIEVKGAILVPLRGIFEAMGASVAFDSATHVISAKKGARTVILPLGSTTAQVDGKPLTLSQPARTQNGVTLIPLRFVAEGLGGYVEWVKAENTVDINTPGQHLSTLPTIPGAETIVGQLTGVYTQTEPQQITMRVNGVDYTVPFTDGAVVCRSQAGAGGQTIPLSNIGIGSQVAVHRDQHGYATEIVQSDGKLRGTVKKVSILSNGTVLVTLNDGNTATLAPNARLTMDGNPIQIADIKPNDRVLISTDPSKTQAFALEVNPQPPIAAGTDSGRGVPEAAGPLINAFHVEGPTPLHIGDRLTVTMNGTTGGSADFSIPGVAYHVRIPEVSAGVYRIAYALPPGVAVDRGVVLGRLAVLGHKSPIVKASEAVTIDTIAPRVGLTFPAGDSVIESSEPLIYAAVSDPGGLGIAAEKCKVVVDGSDVTASANADSNQISYEPLLPLAPGVHTAALTVVDFAGNQSTHDWKFTVAPHPSITEFETNIQPGTLVTRGQAIHFTLQGPANGAASASLVGIGREIGMHQTKPGIYQGDYTIDSGDNVTESPVIGQIRMANGTSFTAALSNGLSIDSGSLPAAPVITSPLPAATVTGELTIMGTAQPYSKVRLSVKFETKAAGDLVTTSGPAADREAAVDATGHWACAPIPLGGKAILSSVANTRYTITAETVEPSGERSAQSTIHVASGRVYAYRGHN